MVLDDTLKVLGNAFLRYVLALADAEDPQNNTNWTTKQQEVHAQLRMMLMQLQIPLGDSGGFALYSALSNFVSIVPGTQRSIANLLRIHAGGILMDAPETKDAFARHMFALAIESYPSYLLPRPRQGSPSFWTSATLPTHQHPSGIDAVGELLRDDSLQHLFPGSPDAESIRSFSDAVDVSSYWTLSNGQGGTQQAVLIIGFILNYAYARLASTGTAPTLARYLDHVRQAIAEVRSLARSEVVLVPQLVGFYNLQLAEGVTVPVADGIFRAPRSGEREVIFPDGGNVHVVLETKFPLKIVEIRPWRRGEELLPIQDDRQSEVFEQSRREAQRRINDARLALLLSSEPGSLASPVEIANVVLSPVTPGGSVSWRAEVSAPTPAATVTAESAARAKDWARTIRTRQAHNLDIGIRRLLSALTTRIDPIDGFVDAVVCWENFFGTQAETTFRVTGAMAWLLEPGDTTKREALQAELKRLYETRSRLVHGSAEPEPAEAAGLRDRAVELATESLRRLYRLPSLLTLKSDTRSRHILLGALQEQQ